MLAAFVSVRNIIDEMIVISFVGAVSNGVGLVLDKYADALLAKNKAKEST
jgi:hypothetical protein